ncbi:EI24 domain-containing protein [Ideonella sp. BN130291]|uniref:EI24 domain-containing protein n=1 Tax=Ideonella sp. BN130291 TaxID=3112940 RepID=UPI002E26A307|nr:EI24 domain-containing protein [Ideonella sp. BN130291]
MKELLDAFWRAVAYCLHPRVIMLSLLPLIIAGGTAWLLGWLFWETAIDAVSAALQSWSLTAAFLQWLQAIGAGGFRNVLPLLIVVALALPVVVVFSLLLVALLMTPALTRLVAVRRFPQLEQRHGGSWWSSVFWSLGCTVVALVALLVSIPLWFVPPLVLIVPPLIWGWLTYRVMTFDVLGDHASSDERRRLLRAHRWPLLGIGVVTGYLGAAPSLLWAMSAATLIFAPLLIVASVWLYTLVFAFSGLWFAHYALAALQRLREADKVVELAPAQAAPASSIEPPLLPPAL